MNQLVMQSFVNIWEETHGSELITKYTHPTKKAFEAAFCMSQAVVAQSAGYSVYGVFQTWKGTHSSSKGKYITGQDVELNMIAFDCDDDREGLRDDKGKWQKQPIPFLKMHWDNINADIALFPISFMGRTTPISEKYWNGKIQGVWTLDRALTDDEKKIINEVLSERYGSDRVTKPCQMLRLPGSDNNKPGINQEYEVLVGYTVERAVAKQSADEIVAYFKQFYVEAIPSANQKVNNTLLDAQGCHEISESVRMQIVTAWVEKKLEESPGGYETCSRLAKSFGIEVGLRGLTGEFDYFSVAERMAETTDASKRGERALAFSNCMEKYAEQAADPKRRLSDWSLIPAPQDLFKLLVPEYVPVELVEVLKESGKTEMIEIMNHGFTQGYALHPIKQTVWSYRNNSVPMKDALKNSFGTFKQQMVCVGTKFKTNEFGETEELPNYQECHKAFVDALVKQGKPINSTIWDASASYGITTDLSGDAVWNTHVDDRLIPIQGPDEYYESLETFHSVFFKHDSQRAFVLDTMAYHYQHPGATVHYALEFVSGKGSGKSRYVNLFAAACGAVAHASIESLTSKFNADVAFAKVVIISESPSKDKRDRPIISKMLDKLIGEVYTRAEPKGQDPFTVKRAAMTCLTTNSLDTIDHDWLRDRIYPVFCASKYETPHENASWLHNLLPYTQAEQNHWFAWYLNQREVPGHMHAGIRAPEQEFLDEALETDEIDELQMIHEYMTASQRNFLFPMRGSEFQVKLAECLRDLGDRRSPLTVSPMLSKSKYFQKEKRSSVWTPLFPDQA